MLLETAPHREQKPLCPLFRQTLSSSHMPIMTQPVLMTYSNEFNGVEIFDSTVHIGTFAPAVAPRHGFSRFSREFKLNVSLLVKLKPLVKFGTLRSCLFSESFHFQKVKKDMV